MSNTFETQETRSKQLAKDEQQPPEEFLRFFWLVMCDYHNMCESARQLVSAGISPDSGVYKPGISIRIDVLIQSICELSPDEKEVFFQIWKQTAEEKQTNKN